MSIAEGIEVVVTRNGETWAVFRDLIDKPLNLFQDSSSGDSQDQSASDTYNDDFDRETEETRQDIIDEVNEYADRLALSDSDGWFYPD